jgi:hypothetical protein
VTIARAAEPTFDMRYQKKRTAPTGVVPVFLVRLGPDRPTSPKYELPRVVRLSGMLRDLGGCVLA